MCNVSHFRFYLTACRSLCNLILPLKRFYSAKYSKRFYSAKYIKKSNWDIFRAELSHASDEWSVQINDVDQSYPHAGNLFQFSRHLWSDGCAAHVYEHVDADAGKIADPSSRETSDHPCFMHQSIPRTWLTTRRIGLGGNSLSKLPADWQAVSHQPHPISTMNLNTLSRRKWRNLCVIQENIQIQMAFW